MGKRKRHEDRAKHAANPSSPLPQAEEEKEEKERDDARRVVNNFYGLWLVCNAKACKRTSRCMGEPLACLDRWREIVPVRQRVFLQFFLQGAKGGASNADAIRFAEEKCEQFAEQIAQDEEQQLIALRARDEAARRKAEDGSIANAPHPARSASHPLPVNGERERPGPRVRAL